MCLSKMPVMFIFDWMESVVPEGMEIMAQDGSNADLRKAGASSEPLAFSVHVPAALAKWVGKADTNVGNLPWPSGFVSIQWPSNGHPKAIQGNLTRIPGIQIGQFRLDQ